MPLLRLIAEGVGPFEYLDVDLSDGKGNPHLGPHIFAGVNGSGKSTVLKALAWVMDEGESGFRYDDWSHLTAGHAESRALAAMKPDRSRVCVRARAKGVGEANESGLKDWVKSMLDGTESGGRLLTGLEVENPKPARWLSLASMLQHKGASKRGAELGRMQVLEDLWGPAGPEDEHGATRLVFRDKGEVKHAGSLFNTAAYSPSRALRHVAAVDLTKKLSSADENALAFESTVQNEFVQSWLLSLYSKRAIAHERKESGQQYTRSLEGFENTLRLLYGQSVSFDVELEPSFQPRLKAFGHNLDFSQLPDGVRSTVGWIADFMMRQDLVQWDPKLGEKRPGVLLLDEIDAHLHPLWQRLLLPAMREALPHVQILVTSHSPFVITSCPNARIHVLEIDGRTGRATARPPVDSPIGESVTTTLKEIFGVESRFDVITERELDEWNTLKKREVGSEISARDKERLKELTATLAERSEELRSIVASPLTIPENVLRTLTEFDGKPQPVKRKKRA